MNCQVCGSRMEKGWGFCPRCGSRASGDFFGEIFSRMRKELAEMNRLMEKDIEAFDLSPWFREIERKAPARPKGSGFTIKIVQSGGGKPDISVRTFGDVDKGKLGREIEGLGALQGTGKPVSRGLFRPKPAKQEIALKGRMRTEEPRTSVASSASKVMVSIQLPGVKSDRDIEICELEDSVEVKALAKDRAYFKILTKPARFRVSKRSFANGVLEMEFS
jgi:HSP20 family molecular chaperone IbpA